MTWILRNAPRERQLLVPYSGRSRVTVSYVFNALLGCLRQMHDDLPYNLAVRLHPRVGDSRSLLRSARLESRPGSQSPRIEGVHHP